jgi:pimeloyl-ACP methyl ester carboxylesterase
MPSVTANGIEHHIQELAPIETMTAVPVVMLHGLVIGSLASWYFTAAPKLAQRRRVRVYDLRGHGRSARVATGYDTATLAADLDALTDDLELFDLVGHSWGGLVALRFALAHPERVRRLVVVEAPLPPSSALDLGGRSESGPLHPGLGSFLSLASTGRETTLTPEQLVEALPESLRAAVASGRRQAKRLADNVIHLVRDTSLVADVRAEPDPSDAELAGLRIPTLALYGDRSACRPAGDRLARVAKVRLVELAGGHYLHLDARAALTKAIEDHLG